MRQSQANRRVSCYSEPVLLYIAVAPLSRIGLASANSRMIGGVPVSAMDVLLIRLPGWLSRSQWRSFCVSLPCGNRSCASCATLARRHMKVMVKTIVVRP